MKYYNTKEESAFVDLKSAILNGLASNMGLDMPENVAVMPQSFFDNIDSLNFEEISSHVAKSLLGDNISENVLRKIVSALALKGKSLKENRLTASERNIVSVAIDKSFEDCQTVVETAFADAGLFLGSANSMNIARLLPQTLYYFYAYAQLKKIDKHSEMVVGIPSGNLEHLASALFARKMGVPIKRFIAATNRDDVFWGYINSGNYNPSPSVTSIAEAMEIDEPNDFERIMAMYNLTHPVVVKDICAYRYNNHEVAIVVRRVYEEHKYLLDSNGACVLKALEEGLKSEECGVFAETLHPVDRAVESIDMSTNLEELKAFLQKYC